MFIRIAVLGEDHVAEMEFQERDTMRNVVERGIQKLNTSDFSLVGLIVVLQPVQTLYIGDKAFQDMQKGIISDNTPGFSLDNTMESWSTNMTQTGPGLQHDPKRIDFVFDVPQRTANNSRFLYAMERRNAGRARGIGRWGHLSSETTTGLVWSSLLVYLASAMLSIVSAAVKGFFESKAEGISYTERLGRTTFGIDN